MKSIMIALACALAAPLAFAQTSTTTEQTTTTTTAPVARTTETTTTTVPVARTSETTTTTVPVARTRETTTTTTYTDGTVTTFEPGKTIVVRREGVAEPVTYRLGKTVRFMNKGGREIKERIIRPGERVHVYYDGDGDARVVSRVVVDGD